MDPSHLLSAESVQAKLAQLPLWKLVDGKLSMQFVAKNFEAALDALNAFGAIAERESHHPDLHLTSYRNVEVILYTHKLGGITEADIALASMIQSEVKVEYSPKWLREHPEAQTSAKSSS